MTKELSALLDGELERHEEPRLWSDLKADQSLQDKWRNYQTIGNALRGEASLEADIRSRVMERLDDEPVVFAPRAARANRWQGSAMALTASLAGIAVVGWLALVQPPSSRDQAMLARVSQPAVPVPATVTRAMPEYREYLLAHQANAPGLHMQGGAQHIRTVSAMGNGQ